MRHDPLRKKLAGVLVAATMVFAVASCGGGGGEKAEVVNSSSEDAGSDVGAGRAGDDTSTGDTSLDEALDEMRDQLGNVDMDGECMQIGLAYMGVSMGALGTMFGGTIDAQELRDQLDDLQADLPTEIEDDFAVVADAFEQLSQGMEGTSGNIMDPEYQQKLEQATAALESPEVDEAQKNIEQYIAKECPNLASATTAN
jgi:hypothetical protein